MADYALLRKNMVESQVRTNDVTDRQLLRAMSELPRELFVPEALKPLAYNGDGVRLTSGLNGRELPSPVVTARLIQLAAIEPTERVLEIGCATGYGTALLAHLAATVIGLESDPALAAAATANLAQLGLANAAIATGVLRAGLPGKPPFDAIVVAGAVSEVPAELIKQLRDGGRVVAVVADGPLGRAMLFDRIGDGLGRRYGFDASAPMLPGFERKSAFAL